MNAWNRYWYTPLASVRPYLLVKSVLSIFALDLCVLMLRGGHWYGHADFNVAHFRWLDALQPLPTQTSYNCVLLLTAILALVGIFYSANRLILVLILMLYTYSWSMSLHDAFQHHYFISLVLFCMACLPNLRASDLSALTDRIRPEPMHVAWSFRLLGVTVAIVYAYAALAKIDAAWFSGFTLQQFLRPGRFEPILQTFAFCGVSEQAVYRLLAVGTIVIELMLAVTYLIATDSPNRSRYRVFYLGMWVLALIFHLGIEVAGIQNIGWFSFYMILLATVFFFPSEWFRPLASSFVRMASWFDRASAWSAGRGVGPMLGILLIAFVVMIGLFAEGRYLDLPGATYAFGFSALLMIAFAANSLLHSRPQSACCCLLAWGAAGSVVLVAVVGTTVRLDYYLQLGHDYRHLGQWTAARDAYQKAADYSGNDLSSAAATQLHMGRSFWSAEQPQQAIDHFQNAIRIRSDYPEAHYNLGMVYHQLQQTPKALVHFREALKYRPDWIPALNQTAKILAVVPDAKLKNPDRAITLAERADHLSGGQNVDVLVTLVIAYQAAGRQEMALSAGKRAAALAHRDGNVELAQKIYKRLGMAAPAP
jgi:hypothetical protein